MRLTGWICVGVCALLLIGQASALQCLSCDTLCNCLRPTTIQCSDFNHNQCYTVKRLSDGKVIRKGCTNDCNQVNDFDGMCTLCRGGSCNIESSLTPMSGSYDECQNENGGLGQGISQNQGIGQAGIGQGFGGNGLGQGVNQPGGLGQGVNQPSGLGQGVNHPGGLGQGINQPGGLGQGVNQPGYGGLGNPGSLNYQPAPSIGAQPQMDRQRFNDDGMGQGFGGQNSMGQGFGGQSGMGQGFNNGGMGQGFRNSAARISSNLLAFGAAYLGLQRL